MSYVFFADEEESFFFVFSTETLKKCVLDFFVDE